MKQLIHPFSFSVIIALVLSACSKPVEIIDPPKPVLSHVFQFAIDSLPGLSAPASEIFAVISVVNSRNEPVITDRKLNLQFNSKFLTEKQELPAGAYRLTKFFVVNGSQVAKYVTPVAGSEKASAVQKPLALAFSLPQSKDLVQPVEVLRIDENLREEQYGYPYGSFKQVVIEPEDFIKVKVKRIIQVSNITYDSIPTAFTLTSWDRNGQVHRKDTQLAAGAQEISLPASHTRYTFAMTKWGVSGERTVNRSDIQEGRLFVLEAGKEAKKLRSEITYLYRNGVYVPRSRINYMYDRTQVSNILYYQNFPDENSPLMTMQDVFHYNGSRLSSIERFDAEEVPNRLGAQTISYDALGRINGVDVNYPMTDLMNVGFRAIWDIEYQINENANYVHVNMKEQPNGPVVTRHRMKFAGGNKTEQVSTGNHYNSSGIFTYDFNINPYAFMRWPEEKFSRQSKNNLATEQETTTSSWGSTITSRSSYHYVYDADGFPTEKIKKDQISGQPLMKVVYTY